MPLLSVLNFGINIPTKVECIDDENCRTDARRKFRLKNQSSTEMVAGATGLEPAASGVTGRRSNQLSYAPGKP
jgi:hypothetical protein